MEELGTVTIDDRTDAPPVRLTIWATVRDPLRYRLTEGDETIFAAADFRPSPLHAIDSPETFRALLTFLTLRPGDTDDEYFENYTERQLRFADERAESLSMYADDEAPPLEVTPPADDDYESSPCADLITAETGAPWPAPMPERVRALYAERDAASARGDRAEVSRLEDELAKHHA